MKITVDTSKIVKKQHNFWNNLHFHPTDAIEDDWGKRILDEVAREKVAQTVRMYAMLEDIVTEKDGKLYYDFTLNDIRLDYMIKKGYNILLSYVFIPPFLAVTPTNKSSVAKNKTRYKGKIIVPSYPKDYSVWQEICRVYTEHIIERYGAETVSGWYLQCYNEPDIDPFFMAEVSGSSDEAGLKRLVEYKKLYKGFADGINEACRNTGACKMKIGGPALAHIKPFLDGLLEYTSKENIQIDYVCVHNYGTNPVEMRSGARPLTVENNIIKYNAYRAIVDKYYPQGMELVIDEWGASSHGFVDKDTYPEMMFRETEVYSAYLGKLITRFVDMDARISKLMICLSGQHEMTEDFSGFRNFFSLNFIKKPIYNAYAATRKLCENVLWHSEVPQNATLLATGDGNGKYALLYTYSSEYFDGNLSDITVNTELCGMADGAKTVRTYRIDKDHLNPYAVYTKNGWGPVLTEQQITQLRAMAQLEPCQTYTAECKNGVLDITVTLTDNCLILQEIF